MSDCCRLTLRWSEGEKESEKENGKEREALLPSSVFYKRIAMGDLAHARLKAHWRADSRTNERADSRADSRSQWEISHTRGSRQNDRV